jgi:ketosteroid isomerase-like protein
MADLHVAARDGILETNQRFIASFAAQDAADLVALYTDDAQLSPPHHDIIEGADHITAFWQGGFDMGLAGASLETLEVDNEGDTAIEVGRYTLTAGDGSTADEGKYLVVWKRIEERWYIHRDIWNTSRPA